MDNITKKLKDHYQQTFIEFGPSPRGVDWRDEVTMNKRLEKMCAVMEGDVSGSLLDVGSGYGGLLEYLSTKSYTGKYTGIDVVPEMVDFSQKKYPKSSFVLGNIMDHKFDGNFDYVVCNGIMTQKLESTFADMDKFSMNVIERMFSLCNKGIAFNMMSSYVNFYAPNLYYKHPAEILINCASRLTSKFKIDHSYELYEFTIYLYK